MPEPTSVLTDRPQGDSLYQPLSALALAAFIVASLFAAALTIVGLIAFISGKAFFVGLWLVAVPLLGLVLAVAAQIRIRHSEGTLAGAKLAGAAWWLSVLFGLGFCAFYFATYLAVRQQAGTFATAWIKRLQDDKPIEAFLLCIEPAQRKSYKAADAQAIYERFAYAPSAAGTRAPLVEFMKKEIVQVLRECGPKAEVRSLGINDWDRDQSGYTVTESYSLASPFAVYDVQIVLRSSEGKEFEGRQWQVMTKGTTVTDYRPSSIGQALDIWRRMARPFAAEWLRKLHEHDLTGAYLDTLEPHERLKIARDFLVRCAADDLLIASRTLATPAYSAPAVPIIAPLFATAPELQRLRFLSGYDRFRTGGLVNTAALQVRPSHRQETIDSAKRICSRPGLFSLKLEGGRVNMKPPDDKPDHIRFAEEVEFGMFRSGNEKGASAILVGGLLVGVESDRAPSDDGRLPTFHIASVDLIRAAKPSDFLLGQPTRPQPRDASDAVPPGS
jgi:hypothetical protein